MHEKLDLLSSSKQIWLKQASHAHCQGHMLRVQGAGQSRQGTTRRVLLVSRKPPTRRVMLNEDEIVEFIQNRYLISCLSCPQA